MNNQEFCLKVLEQIKTQIADSVDPIEVIVYSVVGKDTTRHCAIFSSNDNGFDRHKLLGVLESHKFSVSYNNRNHH